MSLPAASKRQIVTLPSTKPEVKLLKVHTALLPSQEENKGVVEYALYSPSLLEAIYWS
jgi:hypothetical protein